MSTPFGLPIWYELMTPDPEGAEAFYGPLVGWTTRAMPSADDGMHYVVWESSTPEKVGVAGMMKPPAGAPMGPQWLAYFHVTDVDSAVATADAAGARTLMPGTEIPHVGRFALLTDPQGVLFYVMTPEPSSEGDPQAFSESLPQRCNWNELVTTDQQGALEFYGKLLGWVSNEAMPMGEAGDYSFIDVGGTRIGAMMNRMHPGQPLRWGFYFRVPDVDAAAPRVAELGGQMLMGPTEVPGGQRIILCVDPQGAGVGFVSGDRA